MILEAVPLPFFCRMVVPAERNKERFDYGSALLLKCLRLYS